MKEAKQKILIVDDERNNITILVEILKSNYKTIVAKNGEEALKRVTTEQPPDLILLDVMMPKMDGYEVIRQLRESDATKHIPVIFLTAKGQKKDVLKGMELGANDYLVKPYIFADLHGKIEKLIGEKKD